jgi:cytochrome c553
MKTFKIFGIAAIAVGVLATLTLASCSVEKAPAYKNRSGAQAWGENCVRCHSTPSPSSYNDVDWSTIELHMKVRANLTADESEKIFDFLRAAN